MFQLLTRTAVVIALTAAFTAAAPGAISAQAAPGAAVELDQNELEAFAVTYLEVAGVAQEAEVALASVQDPTEAQAIQAEAQQRMQGILDENNMEVDRYRMIGEALNEDEELRDRFIAIVEELRNGGGR